MSLKFLLNFHNVLINLISSFFFLIIQMLVVHATYRLPKNLKNVKNHLRYVKQFLIPTKLLVRSFANPLVSHAMRVGMKMITHVMVNLQALKIHVELEMGVMSPIMIRFAVAKFGHCERNWRCERNSSNF